MTLELIKEWTPLIILGFNAAMFVIIKFNDMIHISKSVDELIKRFDAIDRKLDKTAERIATIEGKCEANHRII